MQLLKLFVSDIARSVGHQTTRLLGLGKCDRVANRFLTGQQHHHAVDAEGKASVRRCSHIQSVHQEAELLLGFLEVACGALGLPYPELGLLAAFGLP